ncbi:T9SS type B sorting domain-containing protein [Reichenbachiella sp.]|uniref:T9SS type B sorting domain-containing protein n=1 Tax=Reichenbachiella sp. TaxID=2184521 RepID=UPI003B5B086D
MGVSIKKLCTLLAIIVSTIWISHSQEIWYNNIITENLVLYGIPVTNIYTDISGVEADNCNFTGIWGGYDGKIFYNFSSGPNQSLFLFGSLHHIDTSYTFYQKAQLTNYYFKIHEIEGLDSISDFSFLNDTTVIFLGEKVWRFNYRKELYLGNASSPPTTEGMEFMTLLGDLPPSLKYPTASFRYRERIYFITDRNELVLLNMDDPSDSKVIHVLEPPDSMTIQGATQVETSCSDVEIFINTSTDLHADITHTYLSNIYTLDVRSGELTLRCSRDENIAALATRTYYEFISDCSLSLDLDDTRPYPFTFGTDTTCSDRLYLSNDIALDSDYGYIDSVVVELYGGIWDLQYEAFEISYDGPIHVDFQSQWRVVLKAPTQRYVQEYIEALESIYLRNYAPSITEGTRHISVQTFADDIYSEERFFYATFLTTNLSYVLNVDSIQCHGDEDGSIQLEFNEDPEEFYWDDGAMTTLVQNLTSGTYTFTATDDRGCEIRDTIILTDPPLLQLSSQVIDANEACQYGTSILISPLGGTPDYDYEWENGLTMDSLSNLGPGTYIVTITDRNECETMDTIVIEPLFLQGDTETELCLGDSTMYDGVLVVQDTIIEQLHHLASGCDSLHSHKIRFTYASEDITKTICEGEYFEFNDIQQTEAGLYEDTLVDNNGCPIFVTLQLDIIEGNHEFDVIANDTVYGINEVVLLASDLDQIIWSTGETGSSITVNQTEWYNLLGVNEEGCTIEDSVFVIVYEDYPIFIPNVFSPNGDGINDLFVVWSDRKFEIISLEIFDRRGCTMYSLKNGLTNRSDLGWDGTFHGRLCPSDVYAYRLVVQYEDETITRTGDLTLVR